MNGQPPDARKQLVLETNTSSAIEDIASNSSSPAISPASSPPYWVQSHQRSFSNISIESIITGGITLQDNELGEDTKSKFCWAKSVYIEDFVVINERRTTIGAFVVWNITVETLRVSIISNNPPECLLTIPRDHRFVFESVFQNLMTFAIDSYKPSPTLKGQCPLYHPRASFQSSVPNSLKTGGLAYSIFSSMCLPLFTAFLPS
jgi:hypothetical protein